MQYIIGIDGGGTKTRGVLISLDGTIMIEKNVGPTNYQLIGIEATKSTLDLLLNNLLENILPEQIQHIYFGLSGADLPIDFEILNGMANSLCNTIPFTVENDTWCVFRSALSQTWGAISLYGTGSNAGAVSLTGEKYILRALGYAAGGFGGGDEMALSALHYAFRSEEGTYTKTDLEYEIPKMFGVNTMNDVVPLVYPEFTISNQLFKELPPLLFDLANKGDQVAIELLQNFGKTQGQMVLGMIQKARLEHESVPVVLGGSVYKGIAPHFINAMMDAICQVAPQAYCVKPDMPPVAGAVLLGFDLGLIPIGPSIYERLKRLPA